MRVPTVPLQRIPLERVVTLNVVEEKDEPSKMRMNPNIPMPNLLKQHPKEEVSLEIKERKHKEGDMKYC